MSSKVSTRVVALATVAGVALGAVSTASAALNLPTQNCNYVFTANLRRGMRNAEVRNLQKVLNMYPQTTIATTGAGSMGMETDFFGAATAAAVVKFQNLHASEILTPAGLTNGTGNVFGLTRAMLNQVCNGNSNNNNNNNTNTTGPVSVMLSSNQPSNVIVAGQANARLADFTFTGNGSVTNVKFMRSGVSSNDTLTNVYLFDNGMRIAGPASVNTNGDINFGSVAGLFTVNGSRTITVRADIKSGVSGQSVGVTMTGYTTAGNSMATTMVAGNALPVANVSLLTADLQGAPSTANPANTSINAGTMNQTVWSRSLSVGTRAAKLHGLTVKMIGSAPVNSIANVKLVVDGSQVATGMVAADGYVYFDTSASPVNLTTGSHTLDVRADVVGGANRNFYMVMEQAGDLRLEDSQVTGAFVTPTANGTSAQAVNVLGGTVTIQSGSLTITQDTSFSNSTNLIGGATNVKLAAYKFTSYGEDVKVMSLAFTPSFTSMTPANNNLANVGLYVNGGQVGSNQTAVHNTTLTYNNLGTNLLVPAGQTVIVELRGDIMSSTSTNYTAGTVKFDLATSPTITNNVQGISSSNITNNPGQTGQTLTVASTNVSFSSVVGFGASTKAPNQTVKIGSFSFVTGSAEGANINNIAVTLAGTMVSGNQLTNLKVMDGSTMIGNSIGTPIVGVNNFSANVNIPVNTTKTFDVWADFQSGASSLTVTPSMQVTYRGAVSNLSSVTSNVAGVQTTAGVGSIVAGGVTFVPGSSPVAQYVVAGQSNFLIGNFNIKSNNGIASRVTKMTVTVPANTISGVTVNGKYQALTTATTAVIDFGSNSIAVPGDASGVNVPVRVDLICSNSSLGSGCTGSSTAVVTAQITSVTYDDGTGAVSTITPSPITPNHILVASRPVVTVAQVSTNGLFNGNVKLGEITVSADSAADISLAQLPITIASSSGISLSGVMLRDSSGSTVIVGTSGTNGTTVLTGSGNFVFSTPRIITKGTSETYAIFGTVAGVAGNAGTASVTFGAGTSSNFLWNDIQGGSSNNTGAAIVNYPNSTQTKTN